MGPGTGFSSYTKNFQFNGFLIFTIMLFLLFLFYFLLIYFFDKTCFEVFGLKVVQNQVFQVL